MIKYYVGIPKTKNELKEYYLLRWKILRKPLNKPLGSEKDELERESTHVFIKDGNNKVIATGRLHFKNDKDGQIRFMAVHEKFQRLGLGTKLLEYLENVALKNNVKNIFLHARDSALNFYLNNDYIVVEKSHLLFNEIQHWLMQKKIK